LIVFEIIDDLLAAGIAGDVFREFFVGQVGAGFMGMKMEAVVVVAPMMRVLTISGRFAET
jgi:hypothetical protein